MKILKINFNSVPMFIPLSSPDLAQCYAIFLNCYKVLKERRTLKCCPVNIFLFKVHYRNTRKRFKIWSKLTIKTSAQLHWSRSGSLLTFIPFSSVSVAEFEQVNVTWVLWNDLIRTRFDFPSDVAISCI